MKYILLPDIGFYAISSVNIQSEGTKLEHKEVTAKSYECLLGQKYLDTFTINMGTTESIDGVRLYNIANPDKSLLHLVLEKCSDWTIGHVDVALQTMERSFEVTKQDVYSFMTTDMSEAFECIFLFDTLTNTINAYQEKNVGEDTDIYVSYNNLLKSTNISCNIDNIKTCLTLTGADDLNIRDINMGYDKIINLEYFNSTDFMSQSLYDAYNKWIKKRNDNLNIYTSLLSQYENYFTQINELTHLKMPSNPDSTNWYEYGLVPLQEKLAAYEQRQAVMMKAETATCVPESNNYASDYLPIYNTIEEIKQQIAKVTSQINSLQNVQNSIYNQMSTIIKDVSMENNFTKEQLEELTPLIREDELSTSNFVVTDTMTDEERFEMLHAFLEYGEEELAKVAVPQLSFDADMVNLFAIPEFRKFNGIFDVGNYIHIAIRDDFTVKAKLLSMTIDFMDVTNFNVTFGNVVKTGNKLVDITDAIALAQSTATSVSFNLSHWNQASKETSNIGKMIDEGLLSQGKYLKSGDDSEMIIDSRGIFVNTTSGIYANKDSIFIGGGRILFTEDNWKTVSMSVGRADVTIKGVKGSYFGTFADFVLAGYIGGTTIEGDEIIGGTITGTDFNNGNGTFHVDSNGNLTATSADVKGTIKADAGYIGGENGFVITTGKLYSGKDSFDSDTAGIYIGTNGIALGKKNVFTVNANGEITAISGHIGGWKIGANNIYNGISFTNTKSNNSTGMGITQAVSNSAFWAGDGKFLVLNTGYIHAESGEIGGATIRSDSLRASNDNWWISSDGSASFKNVFISGVNNGSTFGSIGYNNGITFGNFSGASLFGSNISNPFSGTTIPQIQELAVGEITADRIKARALEAGFITSDTISATYATITNLNGAIARIQTIESDYITTSKLNAHKINADNITTGTLSVGRLGGVSKTPYWISIKIPDSITVRYQNGNTWQEAEVNCSYLNPTVLCGA